MKWRSWKNFEIETRNEKTLGGKMHFKTHFTWDSYSSISLTTKYKGWKTKRKNSLISNAISCMNEPTFGCTKINLALLL